MNRHRRIRLIHVTTLITRISTETIRTSTTPSTIRADTRTSSFNLMAVQRLTDRGIPQHHLITVIHLVTALPLMHRMRMSTAVTPTMNHSSGSRQLQRTIVHSTIHSMITVTGISMRVHSTVHQ